MIHPLVKPLKYFLMNAIFSVCVGVREIFGVVCSFMLLLPVTLVMGVAVTGR